MKTFVFFMCLISPGILLQFECPGSKRKIFTSSDLNVASITAVNQGSNGLTALLSSTLDTSWCVYDPPPLDANSINVTFSSPVVLDTIISEGYTFDAGRYVSAATFYYRSIAEDSLRILKTYQILSASTQTLTVDQPFQLTLLHIEIEDAVQVSSQYCWHLQLIGCLLSDASVATLPSTSSSLSTSGLEHTLATNVLIRTRAQNVGLCTVSVSSSSPSSGQNTSLNDCESLLGMAVGLPIVLALLFILILIASFLFLQEKRKSKNGNVDVTYTQGDVTLAKLDNSELYCQSTREDNNPLYSSIATNSKEDINYTQNIAYQPSSTVQRFTIQSYEEIDCQ